jgi:acyl homoserine lactone synthase
MALVIRPKHHGLFLYLLEQTFRLRRRVFVDGLHWSLPASEAASDVEVDAFDGSAAIYLVKVDTCGRPMAHVRLTPTLRPNLSCDVLGPRMNIIMPRAPHIVEMSRMCAAPDLPKEVRREAMLDLRLSVALLCQREGWSHSIGVGYDHHIQPFIRSGMKVEFLGPPVFFPGDEALSFAIMATDPDRPMHLAELLAGRPTCLQDPDEDPTLISRYGDHAVAA